MSDVVVTVPLSFGLDNWIDEGDAAGEPDSGLEWDFYLGGPRPNIKRGERVYVVYNGAIRGYAPLVRVAQDLFTHWRFSLVRHGSAVALTIPEFLHDRASAHTPDVTPATHPQQQQPYSERASGVYPVVKPPRAWLTMRRRNDNAES
jgi:hypothetical protein